MGCLNIALTAATDFSMFFSSINRTYLSISLLLFICKAKSMQRLHICVNSIPVSRSSPVDTFILSRLTQISGRHGRDLCQPGSNKCSSINKRTYRSRRSGLYRGSPVFQASTLHTNRLLVVFPNFSLIFFSQL